MAEVLEKRDADEEMNARLALFQKAYNEEVQAFALQQMGQRRRGQYEDGVPRIQISSPSA